MAHFVWFQGAWWPAERAHRPSVFPAIHSDHMAPLRHQATGEVMDSKSQFRRATRDAGCVELGNDVDTSPRQYEPDTGLKAGIAEAWQMVEQGYRPEPGPAADDLPLRIYE